jgi:hypothetical protein
MRQDGTGRYPPPGGKPGDGLSSAAHLLMVISRSAYSPVTSRIAG